jgi:hypothetical protein
MTASGAPATAKRVSNGDPKKRRSTKGKDGATPGAVFAIHITQP